MKAHTMLDILSSRLGTPLCAVPLSLCSIVRPYLLDRAGIPLSGTAMFFAIPYVMTEDIEHPARNLSLYAVPRDYHIYVKELEIALLPELKNLYPENRFALFADHSPILEIQAAAKAGLGIVGRNGLLITPQYGSFVFLAEICTDADYKAVTGTEQPVFPENPPICENCGACRSICPAQNANTTEVSCLSALTQKKGDLTGDECISLQHHNLIWGCDLCQLVCPHNLAVIAAGRDTPIPYFRENRVLHLNADTLRSMENDEFALRAYAWRGRKTIERNMVLVDQGGMT